MSGLLLQQSLKSLVINNDRYIANKQLKKSMPYVDETVHNVTSLCRQYLSPLKNH